MISIIIPHAMNEENDKVLALNLQMLKENTTCAYEVLIFSDNSRRKDLVYRSLDWMIRQAKYDLVLWGSTDVVLSPDWNNNVLKYSDLAEWICLQLVECGEIAVHSNNIEKDFGRTAETFDRKGFEEWSYSYSLINPPYREAFCWYSPSVFRKDWYINSGGFDLSKDFPHHTDKDFIERVEKQTKFITVNSYAYHFQRANKN